MKTIFEEMGGTYRQVGDYFIPSITLPDDGEYQIGKYGRMRRREHCSSIQLKSIKPATSALKNIVSAMAKQEGVTEALKAADQIEWVRRMNSIQKRAKEMEKSFQSLVQRKKTETVQSMRLHRFEKC